MKRLQAVVFTTWILCAALLPGCALSAQEKPAPQPQQRAQAEAKTALASEVAEKPAAQQRVQELLAVIRDENRSWRERREALLALRGEDVRPAAESAIPTLIEVLADRTPSLRQATMNVLAQMRPASVPALKQALEDPKKELAAVRTFEAMGRNGVPFLSELLGHRNPAVRRHAAEVLSRMGGERVAGLAAATAPLTRCLADESPEVREAAVKALARIGPPAASAAPDFLGIAADEKATPGLRVSAIGALGQIGAPAAQELVKTLTNAKAPAEVRTAAAGTLGSQSSPVVRTLAGILTDRQSDPGLRASAAETLASVSGPAAAALAQTLRDPAAGTAVRVAAAAALGNFGPLAAPLLLEVLTDADERVRWQAAIELGDMPAQTVPAIAARLTDENVLARRYAAFALGKMGPKASPAIPALTAALKDREPVVRRNAAGALGAIGVRQLADAAPALAALLNDADPEVCVAAVHALGALKTDAAGWAKEIEGILSTTKNVKLQWASAYALDRIVGARPMEVKREVLQVKSYVLNKYIPMLDGQWQGTLVATDGNCYFGASTHWPDHGAAFFRYNPRKDELRLLCDDINKVCGEDPQFAPGQGKIHSPVVEKDGWLYFGTHLSDYSEWGMRAYPGAHLIGYEMATGKFRDYGIIRPGFTNYSALDLDPERNKIYFLCVSFGHNYGSHIYRIDINTGEKEDLGAITPGHSSGYSFFVDRRGDAWLAVKTTPAVGRYDSAFFHVSGETGKITRWEGALPSDQQGWFFGGFGRRLSGSDLGLVIASGKLWIFDPTADRDAPGAFMPVKDAVGGECMTKDRIYWVGRGGLQSLSLDVTTRPAIIKHGELRDQDGRRGSGGSGLAVDPEGRVMMIGRWGLLPGEEGTLTEHRSRWCLVFSVVDVSGDLANAGVAEGKVSR